MSFNFYGVFVSLGIFMGFWVAERLNKRYQLIQKFSFWDSLLWLVVPGVAGARAYHVIDYWTYYSQNPIEIIKIWQGGLGIFGAMIGGLIGLVLFILQLPITLSSKPFLKILDLGVIGLALGQSIGRWGNYFNHELLPMALWESLADFLIFCILLLFLENIFLKNSQTREKINLNEKFLALTMAKYISKFLKKVYLFSHRHFRKTFSKISSRHFSKRSQNLSKIVYSPGKILFLYLILYGLVRFGLEFVRAEPWFMGKVMSLMMVIIGVAGFWKKR